MIVSLESNIFQYKSHDCLTALAVTSQEIVAISCSWCKTAFHNKESCFNIQRIGENCTLGIHQDIIVPPSWIVKLPRKVSLVPIALLYTRITLSKNNSICRLHSKFKLNFLSNPFFLI